jgi:hypothetical protein
LADAAYIPVQLQQQVKNNLGGHWNHSFFWELMKPGGAKEPSTELKSAIEGSWKDVNEFKEKLNAAGAGPLRLGVGVARRQQQQKARTDLDRQPGHADPARRQAGDRGRCVGARLLPEVPEPPARLSESLVEYGELGQGFRELQEGDGLNFCNTMARCVGRSGPADDTSRPFLRGDTERHDQHAMYAVSPPTRCR